MNTHRPTRLALLGLFLVGLTLATACKAGPVPGRVALAGDSLTFQGGYYGGGYGDFDQTNKVMLGWQAEHAQPRLTTDVQNPATSPQYLVVAFGQNDAGTGLDDVDRAQIRQLALTPADSGTCTVFVKPWYAGNDPVRIQGITDYRAFVNQLVAEYPGRVVAVDWLPTAIQPGMLDPDGFHLTPKVGAPAYNALIRSAPEACDA